MALEPFFEVVVILSSSLSSRNSQSEEGLGELILSLEVARRSSPSSGKIVWVVRPDCWVRFSQSLLLPLPPSFLFLPVWESGGWLWLLFYLFHNSYGKNIVISISRSAHFIVLCTLYAIVNQSI